MGIIFQSQNQPKLDFSVGVTNPRGIPIPMGNLFPKSKSAKTQFFSWCNKSHGNSFPKSKSAKIWFFSWCNKSQGNSNSHGKSFPTSKSPKYRFSSWCNKSHGNSFPQVKIVNTIFQLLYSIPRQFFYSQIFALTLHQND